MCASCASIAIERAREHRFASLSTAYAPLMLRRLPVCIDTFDREVGPALRRSPVLNQVELGIVDNARADPSRYPEGVRMLAVRDDATGEIGVAMQTPPHTALVSTASDAIAAELGRLFAAEHSGTRSVFGPEAAALAFAEGAGGREPTRTTRGGVYELRTVQPVTEAAGCARLATPDDATLLQSWLDTFVDEALPPGWPKDPKAGARMAGDGRTWLWIDDHGAPVSLTNNSRRVAGWWAVSYVFTPREHRGRAYATALVAHVSRWALEHGAVGCTLFADLENPVSNRIYERIGYRRIGTHVTVAW
jgi:RimJ/RimL family protein N-acetyltransferase